MFLFEKSQHMKLNVNASTRTNPKDLAILLVVFAVISMAIGFLVS